MLKYKIPQIVTLTQNKPIYIVMNKKEGASYITTHLLFQFNLSFLFFVVLQSGLQELDVLRNTLIIRI